MAIVSDVPIVAILKGKLSDSLQLTCRRLDVIAPHYLLVAHWVSRYPGGRSTAAMDGKGGRQLFGYPNASLNMPFSVTLRFRLRLCHLGVFLYFA